MDSIDSNPNTLLSTLKKHFGFQDFRPGQLDALSILMTHGRLICIQPTGHGKSLLYQLPALLLPGITVVISPLLALMRDQLSQLKTRFGIPAASINTDQSPEENMSALNAARYGKIRILFIAPEQLDNLYRFNFLLDLPIDLLVVDEAHCISTWGHDFRPSYRAIISLTKALAEKNPNLKLLGLTATANKKTEEDIKQQLSVGGKEIVIQRESMNRPNIRLSVMPANNTSAKLTYILNLVSRLEGAGLIYCATRENTELVADYLSSQGIKTIAYHAGIDPKLKRDIQTDFILDKYKVIAATNALGMGIDKSNLRFVIHFDFPGSITAYYQEVGRAGRDGLHAEGILLYDPKDSRIQHHFIESAQPDAAEFQRIIKLISGANETMTIQTLKRLSGMHPTKLNVLLAELTEQGFIEKKLKDRVQIYERTHKNGQPKLERYASQRRARQAELRAMQNYAEQSRLCLMHILREALGDHEAHACGQCSICTDLTLTSTANKRQTNLISNWLSRRTPPITIAKKIKNTYSGLSVLDGKLRSDHFVSFMRERANPKTSLGMTDDLIQEVINHLKDMHKRYHIQAIIPLPSRTWQARMSVIETIGTELGIKFYPDILHWKNTPNARQGELLNNDQRKFNVHEQMRARSDRPLPNGTLLLIDDYIGSGATMNEAARALREQDIDQAIIPFTIAAVRWKIGSTGII